MKKMWNYSIDGQPEKEYNIPEKDFLFEEKAQAIEACKVFCKEYGFEYDENMVGEVEVSEN